jgi:hypothetical protein
MRPERLDGMNSLSAGNLRAILGLFCSHLFAFLAKNRRAPAKIPRRNRPSCASTSLTTKSFLDELAG